MRRAGFTLIEAMVAITLTSVIVVLVGTVFLVQNNFFTRLTQRSAAHDNARMVTELVAEGVRSVTPGGVVVANNKDLVLRSPIVMAVVCAQPSSSTVTVHMDGGLSALDTTEVGGFGVRDAGNGSWKYYDVGWSTIYQSGGTPATDCAANGADTVGATAEFLRLRSLSAYYGSNPPVGSILMLYRNLEFTFAPSGMDSTTYGLYRGLYGGTLVEFATGMDTTASFQYRTGGSSYATSVGGKELKNIDAIRIVALANKSALTGGQANITYGWSVNLALRNSN